MIDLGIQPPPRCHVRKKRRRDNARSEVKGSRVVELPNTNHYMFIVEEALVVREMREFLLAK